jgi:hypothetical protein
MHTEDMIYFLQDSGYSPEQVDNSIAATNFSQHSSDNSRYIILLNDQQHAVPAFEARVWSDGSFKIRAWQVDPSRSSILFLNSDNYQPAAIIRINH